MDCETVANEIREERAAIAEHDGLLSREDAERLGLLEEDAWRHSCECRRVATMAMDELQTQLVLSETKRGDGCLLLWHDASLLMLLRTKSRESRIDYLKWYAEKRGLSAANKLRDAVRAAWNRRVQD